MNPHEILNVSPMASRAEIRTAYRELARRWHPDRFMEGPERDWASEKMAQINAAYHACLAEPQAYTPSNDETPQLRRIEELINGSHYRLARQMLMGITTRCAEWNYLFGTILFKTLDCQKALIYLGIAARQQPENAKYARALREAQNAKPGARKGLSALMNKVRSR